MTIIVLVGLPGCGKSTKAKELEKQGYIIHSSDAIKNELNLHNKDDISNVYNILYDRIISDMKLGKNIVYDSTNLTVKRRKDFLNKIKNFNYNKICYTFIVPIDICKERNSYRTGYAKVTNKAYDNMIRLFELPTIDEGWNKIIYLS